MNYTKQVREYCEKHVNSLVDISIVRDSVFADIPYKTLLKIFNRLEDDGIVQTVSKGLYSVGNKVVNNKLILSQYTKNGKGMVVGYTLFNSIGLTATQEDRIVIFTNAIANKQKTIGNILLKRVDLEFTDEIIDLISLLEIINVGFSMKGADYLSYKRTVELLALSYSDDNFRKVIKAIRYMYSTVLKLSELLARLNIENSCLDIYQLLA
ncbi:MAG: hypothetical protein MR239_03945 [Clostridiales bacterium]|nr:hypothetical protein [Clostridiales bacterium]MDY4655838.1 hypothetical protein [Eubacteriales bacterium]